MNPQGSGVINLSQYEKMAERVEGVRTCEQLQTICDQIISSLNAENAAILDQLEKLGPIAALLEAPTSPDKVITWISDYIEGVLKPLCAPALTYPSQIAARTLAIADLISVINNKSNQFKSCSITFPTP